MADPDFQIRGGGPDPEIRGSPVSKKNFFQPFRPQFGLKIRPLLPSPGSTTGVYGKHSRIISMSLIVWKNKRSRG